MAQLNIAERRVPQDGRIKLKFGAKVIDYRVSTLPVLFGEKIVLRILDKGNLTLDLTKFGFEPKARGAVTGDPEPVRHGAGHGPDGVGQDHNPVLGAVAHQPDRCEHHDRRDPVEYNLMGINQVLVRNDVGMTFARR